MEKEILMQLKSKDKLYVNIYYIESHNTQECIVLGLKTSYSKMNSIEQLLIVGLNILQRCSKSVSHKPLSEEILFARLFQEWGKLQSLLFLFFNNQKKILNQCLHQCYVIQENLHIKSTMRSLDSPNIYLIFAQAYSLEEFQYKRILKF